MVGIRNIKELCNILSSENMEWQKKVFNHLGVVVIPGGERQFDWELYSSCGRACLDDNTDTDCLNEKGMIAYVVINCIDDLIQYISEMDTYRLVLKDIRIGSFFKSELFAAIYNCILMENTYANGDFVYGLKAIHGTDGSPWRTLAANELWFDMSMCGIDQLAGIEVLLAGQDTLSDVLKMIATQLKEFRDIQDWPKSEVPLFTCSLEKRFVVPTTFEDVVNASKYIRY